MWTVAKQAHQQNVLCNLRCKISLLQLHRPKTHRLASVFQSEEDMSCHLTSLSFLQTWILMTSVLNSALLQNSFIFEQFRAYSCIFSIVLYIHGAAFAAAAPLTLFISVFALMLDVLLLGLYFVMGAKVSWLASQLSSALQQFKWTRSESSLKNLFSLSRR